MLYPLKRKTSLKRGKPPKRTGFIRRIGKKTVRDAGLKKELLDIYFEKFGIDGFATCQICGRTMGRYQADACHKVRASQGGKCLGQNILAAHGFRTGPRNCHNWADRKASRYRLIERDHANIWNGEIVKWEPDQKENLELFLSSGLDPFRSR